MPAYRANEALRRSVLKLKLASYFASFVAAVSKERSVPTQKLPFPKEPEKFSDGLLVKLIPVVTPK